MPVPPNLDYERWLGAAPDQPYMEGRVHPQNDYGRPGWITTEDFGLGMITNWGAHHVDIGLWALGLALSGPTSITARAEFMKNDVWTVHHTYHAELGFAGGILMILDNTFANGLRFEGSEGWVFCSRDAARVTRSDGNANDPLTDQNALRASDQKILAPLPAGSVRWEPSPDHYLNWLEAVAAGRDPIAPVEHAVRSLEACYVAWLGMKLGRKLTWDPASEAFVGDDEANALRARRRRKGYELDPLLSQAGLTA
jgi:predicted dehydrogenase